MSPSTDIRQKAITLIKQLPQGKLTAAVQLLELLTEPSLPSPLNENEISLINVIQQQLPDSEQTRLNDLRHRCEWSQLTEAAHQELICYEDQLEQYRVDRLAALIELAKLRNVDLVSLNRQFQSVPQSSNAA